MGWQVILPAFWQGGPCPASSLNWLKPFQKQAKMFLQAMLHLIGKSVEGEDRSINVHGHLVDATKQKLFSGMFVQANILVDSQKGFSIPKDAVFLENGKNYVLVLKSHQKGVYSFDKAFVEKGSSNEDFIEIKLNDIVTNKTSILTKGVFAIFN